MEKSNKKEKWISRYFQKKQKPPNFFLAVFVTTLKMFLILIVILIFAGFGAALGVVKAYVDTTPELDLHRIEDQSQTSLIYDKDGNLITEYYGFENRLWASLDEIPEMLQNAFIAIEDVRFYHHHGLDYKRLLGALINNLKGESVQGGSTITQQLIKNTMLTPERTYKRKIQEMYLALQLEKKYTKEEILEAYLNTIHLGGSNYGVKAAAKDYFGKELKDLTLRECAVLAGITKNPSLYDPRKNLYERQKPEITFKRANLVLQAMYENGFITKEQYQQAKFDVENPQANDFKVRKEPLDNNYPMPYFIEYVIEDVRDKLMEKKGLTKQEAEELIYSGGLKIYTTVDPKIQKTLEEVVCNYKKLPSFPQKEYYVKIDSVSGREISQPQVAAVIIDHHTGEIRAIVGGKQPPEVKRGINRVKRKLPVGSAIKPLSVYGPFIEAGYPGGIIIEDIPAPINGWNSKRGYPRNYSDKYSGPVDVRTGIRKSVNVVAARILMERIGPEYSARFLKNLGITSEEYIEKRIPNDLALGTDGISMIEMVGAYAAIANKGIYQQPISFTKVIDKNGNEILNSNSFQIKRRVFKESTTFILTEWMQEVVKGGTGTAARFREKPMHIAGKTGTNTDYKGVYFAGFTPYYTATVWIGHDDYKAFASGTTGGKYAAPLWRAFMEPIHQDLEDKPFYSKVPKDVIRVKVCGVSGMLPNKALCSNDIGEHDLVKEWFPKDAVPRKMCDWHKEITVCKYSGKLPSPFCPEEALEKRSVIILPEDSPYRRLTDEKLNKYLPGAFKDLIDLEKLDYNNPEDIKYFCPLHTQEWMEAETQREILSEEANRLIEQIKADMDKHKNELTQEDTTQLNEAIFQVEESLKNGMVDPETLGDEPLTELPLFDAEIVQQKIDYLNELANTIFSKIEQSEQTDENNQRENNENNDQSNPLPEDQ